MSKTLEALNAPNLFGQVYLTCRFNGSSHDGALAVADAEVGGSELQALRRQLGTAQRRMAASTEYGYPKNQYRSLLKEFLTILIRGSCESYII